LILGTFIFCPDREHPAEKTRAKTISETGSHVAQHILMKDIPFSWFQRRRTACRVKKAAASSRLSASLQLYIKKACPAPA
jgi:hypothetical protein